MADLNIMPLMTDSLVGDTPHLDDAEFGSYLALLIAGWRNGGWLPNDPDLLRKYARCKPANWAKRWRVLEPFFYVEGDRLLQKKQVEIYKKAIDRREKFRANGKKGGEAKSLKNNDRDLASGHNAPQEGHPARPTNLKPESLNPNRIDSAADAARRISKPRKSTLPPEVEPAHKAYFDRAQALKLQGGQSAQLLKAHGFHKPGATVEEMLAAIQRSRANLEAAASAKVPRSYLGAIIRRLGDTEAKFAGVDYDGAF